MVSSPFPCRMKILEFDNSRNCHHNAQDEQCEKTLHDGLLSLEFNTRNELYRPSIMVPNHRVLCVRVGLLPEVAKRSCAC